MNYTINGMKIRDIKDAQDILSAFFVLNNELENISTVLLNNVDNYKALSTSQKDTLNAINAIQINTNKTSDKILDLVNNLPTHIKGLNTNFEENIKEIGNILNKANNNFLMQIQSLKNENDKAIKKAINAIDLDRFHSQIEGFFDEKIQNLQQETIKLKANNNTLKIINNDFEIINDDFRKNIKAFDGINTKAIIGTAGVSFLFGVGLVSGWAYWYIQSHSIIKYEQVQKIQEKEIIKKVPNPINSKLKAEINQLKAENKNIKAKILPSEYYYNDSNNNNYIGIRDDDDRYSSQNNDDGSTTHFILIK